MNLFNEDFIRDWEEAFRQKNEKRMFKTVKSLRDPRLEKWNDYRHHRMTKYFYHHENKYVRNMTQRKFRRKYNQAVQLDEELKIVPHHYKTYGWICW
jgi:hypothetical protein